MRTAIAIVAALLAAAPAEAARDRKVPPSHTFLGLTPACAAGATYELGARRHPARPWTPVQSYRFEHEGMACLMVPVGVGFAARCVPAAGEPDAAPPAPSAWVAWEPVEDFFRRCRLWLPDVDAAVNALPTTAPEPDPL